MTAVTKIIFHLKKIPQYYKDIEIQNQQMNQVNKKKYQADIQEKIN